MQPENFAELLRQSAEANAKRQAAEAIETQVKVLSALFDKSAAYTNLMILAGYAGYFGLWQLTKEFLTKQYALWSALLILCSLVTFVFFEVVKMLIIHHNISAKARILKSPEVQRSPMALQKAFVDIGAVHERVGLHFIRFWLVCLVVIISTAMAGTGILAYSFVSGLSR